MLKIGVLVSGGGTNFKAVADKINSGYIQNAEIVTVVASSEKAYALTRAREYGIEALCISKKNCADYEQNLINHFQQRDVGLILLAGFMIVLGGQFIEAYRNKIINIHPSLIPSFCGEGFYGLKVHEQAILKGVKLTGATVHFVDEGTDTGPIILQKAVEVFDGDTPEALQKRVMEQAEWMIFPEAVKLFAEGRLTIENNKVRINSFKKLKS